MKSKRRFSRRFILYGYFLALIAIGTILLALPASWGGSGGWNSVPVPDAFFTAVSAACVTGLVTLDTALWSRFGQGVILALIQAGGLGIVSFGMLYIVLPRLRISLRDTKMLKDSFVPGQTAVQTRSVIKSIFITTILIEGLGALLLSVAFGRSGREEAVFAGVFHAVSAFCNAGFSLFSDGLASYRADILVNITVIVLIFLGGIGFMVIRDLRRKITDRRRPLQFHSRLMLIAAPAFIAVGFLGYLLLDSTGVFADLPPGERLIATLFQSVSTRTAGFSTVDQAALSPPSRWLTLVLMLIGGGSGSTAGGIKVSTAFILFLVLFQGVTERGDLRFLRRRIPSADVSMAAMFFLKAMALLFVAILALGILEPPAQTGFSPSDIIFECVSAMGTVGLSAGITGMLSTGGKLVVAATMFVGRVGLFSLVIRSVKDRTDRLIDYPKGEVLIG